MNHQAQLTVRRHALSAALLFLSLALIASCMTQAVHADDIKGQFFLPISARYIDNLGVGAGLGWQDHKTGFIVMAQLTYDRIDGVTTTIKIPNWCIYGHCDDLVQWSRPREATIALPDRNVTGVTLTMGIPITGRKGKK